MWNHEATVDLIGCGVEGKIRETEFGVEDFGELLPGPIIRLVRQNANKDDFWLNSCIISRLFQKEKLLSLTCTRKCQHHVFKNQGNRVWGLDLVEDF